MNVLIACEESGTVRDEFIALGHNAVSCDILPSRKLGPHIQGCALKAVRSRRWDLLIFHAECTFMSNSGAKHLYLGMKKENGRNEARWAAMREAALFFKELWDSDVDKICGENPIMLGYAKEIIGAEPSQIIQPWMFGHGETKATCLWLKGLPKLIHTDIVSGREQRIWKMAPGPNRKRDRSVTFTGVAKAMASQWGNL